MAPELLMDDEHYGPAVDVYAFAILAYEIVTGKEPFSDKGKTAGFNTIMKKITTGGRPEFTEGVQDNMKELITQCWSQNPNDRPSFDTIFEKLSSEFTFLDESVDEDEINEYLANLEESRKLPTKNVNSFEKIEEENKLLIDELNKLKDENKMFKDQISKNAENQKEIVKLKTENSNLKDQLRKSEEDKKRLQTELDKLKDENKKLQEHKVESIPDEKSTKEEAKKTKKKYS